MPNLLTMTLWEIGVLSIPDAEVIDGVAHLNAEALDAEILISILNVWSLKCREARSEQLTGVVKPAGRGRATHPEICFLRIVLILQ